MPNQSLNSLGFAKPEAQTRVVVAMSGGVDSSVCAAMLAREGYDVIGVTLQLYDHGAAIQKAKACCAGQDIYDAKRVAEMMDFPHYVLDYESNFKEQVIEDFADTYLKGATPIPCVRCNQTVKFKDLLAVAKDLGADCMATGHYIRRIDGPDGPELHRAFDGGKDQSYFLFATTKDQLDFLRFPLGAMDKSETRKLAVEMGLNVAGKPDRREVERGGGRMRSRLVKRRWTGTRAAMGICRTVRRGGGEEGGADSERCGGGTTRAYERR